MLIVGIVLGVLGLVLSYYGVAALRFWAERRQIFDVPNARSSHTRPTPRGGGLAIVLVILSGLLVSWLFTRTWSLPAVASYLLAGMLIAAVSWIDDLRSLSNRIRFSAHSLAAVLALWNFGYWERVDVPLFGQIQIGWLGILISFVWIVGLTNAYNFMDGIDGIAGGQALIAGLGWAAIGYIGQEPLVSSLGLLLATSSLGFLAHNWHPARIFMGDVGSAFLGYTFAVLPFMLHLGASNHLNSSLSAAAGVLLVWPFVFDAAFTFLRRLRNGEQVFAAHRSHLYQRLVIAGWGHRAVSLLYISLAFGGLLLSLGWVLDIQGIGIGIALLIPLLGLGLWLLVVQRERHHAAHIHQPAQLSNSI